jgi:hypothetical protein
VPARQGAESVYLAGERRGQGGRQDDDVGADGSGGVLDAREGRVGAEVGDALAEVVQGQAEGHQPQRVVFARHAREDERIAWGRLYVDEVEAESADIDAVVRHMAGTEDR